MAHDERRSIRYPLGMRCVYRLREAVMEPVSAVISDVSRQGCRLETDTGLGGQGEEVEIHFQTPYGGPRGQISGLVIQRQKTPLGWILGVEFREADPAVKWELLDAAYRRWRDSLAPEPGIGEAVG
jgi:hypothetical protein